MKNKILIALAVVILGVATYAFIRLRPSADINEYQEYFVDDSEAPVDSAVRVTFFGVSTLLIDDGETQILIDGFFSRYSMSRALFRDMQTDSAVIDELVVASGMNRVKGIFVTHTHYDHAFDIAYTARKTGATAYGSASTLNVARGGGLGESQLKLFQPNVDIAVGDFTVRVVPSKHSPGNNLEDDAVTIDAPLRQPASIKAYPEGGSFDFLLKHGGHSIYIKPSPNFVEGALDSLSADVLFLGLAIVSKQGPEWRDQFYDEIVGALSPALVIPIHWDNFFEPVSDELVMLPSMVGEPDKDFDFFIEKTKADNIDFKILQGTKSIVLFK
jgi:L-ascorbate metabolism protein UlaG (beta-lactamase superfamily)